MNTKIISVTIIVTTLIFYSSVFADEETKKLGVITVTSPGTEQKIEDVQATVEVIDEAKIRSFSRRSLSQVLEYATSFFVRDQGSNSRITLRGFEDDHTLILVDGMRRTVKYGNQSADLNGLQLEDVERIEIVRGPMSALYGSEALSGVINIVTKRGSGEKSLQTTLVGGVAEKGERDTVIFSGSADLGTIGSTRHRASFEVKNRDEFREKHAPYTELNDEEKIFLSYRGNYDIGAYHWIGWDFEYYDEDDDGISSAGNIPTFEKEERYHYGVNYHNEADIGIFDVSGGYGKNDAESNRTGGTEETDYEQWEGNVFFTRSFFDTHTVTLGAGARTQEMEHTIYSDVPDRDVYHALVQEQWKIVDDVTLVLGIRYDDYSDFGDTTNPKATLSWQPGNWSIRASYGEAFKAPSFAELYSYFTRSAGNRVFDVTGNPDLEPEESKTYEGALGYRDQKFGAEVVYHYSEVDDLINAVTTLRTMTFPGPVFHFDSLYENVSNAEIDGIEFTFNTRPWDFLELFGAWEYLHKEDADTGERLVGYARHRAKLGMTMYVGKAKFDARYLSIMDFYDIDPENRLGSPVESNYFQVDFRIGYELFKNHELFCGIDNLLDDESPENWTRGGYRTDPGARYYYIGYTANWF